MTLRNTGDMMLGNGSRYHRAVESLDFQDSQRNHTVMEKDAPNRKPLAYRLRDAVHYGQRDGSPILVLNFPLKSIVLHPGWRPLFEFGLRGNFIPFEKIVSLVDHADTQEMEIFLNGLVRKGFLEQEGVPSLSHYPSVSIIVPVRNRPDDIVACIQSLFRLDYPAEKMEVMVVDDASDDDTPDVVSAFPVHLHQLREHKGASFCRNLAAQRAKGKILAFLDSDCLVDPLWLKELVPAFSDSSNGAVGGAVDSYLDEKGLDRYEKVRSSLNRGSCTKSSREETRFFYLSSCNLLVRRALFLQVGGFREDMAVGEDVDFCWRLQDQGYHIEYRPIGKVYHKHRNKIRQFCARRFDYGTSEPLLQKFHTARIKQFLFPFPHAIFYGLVILYIVSGWMPLLGLCGLIVLTDSLINFTRIYRKNIPIYFPHLLLATFRNYCMFFYHCCAFCSRYYLFWSPVIYIVSPMVSVTFFCMHLLSGIGEYFIKKPRLRLPSFLFYFSLDQLAYQLGVWWGCFTRLCFSPVNPHLVRNHKAIG
jgi:mycofactocin system glycosyltransferase